MILARFTKILRTADIELSADGRTEEWKDGKRTAQLHVCGRTATEVRRVKSCCHLLQAEVYSSRHAVPKMIYSTIYV